MERFFLKAGSSKKSLSLSKTKNQSVIKDIFTTNNLQITPKKDQDDNVADDQRDFEELVQTKDKGKGRLEEPLFVRELLVKEDDIDMDEDTVWQKTVEQSDVAGELKDEESEDEEDFVEAATPQFNSLKVTDDDTPVRTPSGLKRKRVGEDVFTREFVKKWQGSRIKAWENRYLSPEGFYYRFVVPGEGQKNGGWTSQEHVLFMERYNEWIAKGYKVGASWGLFSVGIPHRVGYQCMNYYRKLVSEGRLKDDSYVVVDGKLKQVHKERAPGGIVPVTELGQEWQDEDIKQEEKNVDLWLKEFHGRSGCVATSRPIAAPKPKSVPRIVKRIIRKSNIGALVKNMPPRTDFDNDECDPEIAHLQKRDWESEWRERLDAYKKFMEPYLDENVRYRYLVAKQVWRSGLFTTQMLYQRSLTRTYKMPPSTKKRTKPPTSKLQQSTLSRFFTGVKKVKIDTPEDMISLTRIPKTLFSGVKKIKPLCNHVKPEESKSIYMEFDDINDSVSILNDILDQGAEKDITRQQSNLEGILVDPPWEYHIVDGKNDGKCTMNLIKFQELMEKVVCHMSAGMVFVWTHKLIQADVIRIMYTLDCKYVENLVWFKKTVANAPLDEPSPYISTTKDILLMFKKGEGFDLRHQRSADVIIDYQRPIHEWIDDEYTEPKPRGVFDVIETMLPMGCYDESLNRGRFLELWAKKKAPRREGWIAFHENKIDKTIAGTNDSIKLEQMEE